MQTTCVDLTLEFHFSILPIAGTSEDDQNHEEHAHTDDSQINGLVLPEISIREHIVPVHRRWQGEEPTRKRGQVSGEALRLRQIGQWSNLEE